MNNFAVDFLVVQYVIKPIYIMAEQLEVKELDQVVVRFSGDSGEHFLYGLSYRR